MATFEITNADEKIHELLRGNQGMAALLGPLLNQILQGDLTDHLGTESGERPDERQGDRASRKQCFRREGVDDEATA